MPGSTMVSMLSDRGREMPDRPAFTFPDGEGWKTLTWAQTVGRVRAIASALAALGVKPEERCAILSSTRIEWILADLGILSAGAATTTIYPASTAEDARFILSDSGSVVAFVEDATQVEKVVAMRAQLPALRKVVVFDGMGDGDWVIPFAALEARGREAGASSSLERAESIRPDRLATLIYTSGTTGRPKGVELTHDCWAFEGEAIASLGMLRADDHQYLWLPLAHSFGKVLQSAQLATGFHTTVDGRVPKLVENLAVVRPTFMAAAPRIFEKVHAKVLAGVPPGTATKRIFDWSMGVGRRVAAARRDGRTPALRDRLAHVVADRVVLGKLRARFGGRLRFFVSGSAPLSREVSEFFHAAGILILEGYGLTESSAASFVNLPGNFAFGTVGAPLPGVEVSIAADGEILLRGRGIMRAYHGLPAETAEAIDAQGWLHTGDVGELDAAGRLRITDRKKELIKTSGGKYVAPQALEGKLKALSPYISQVVVHGDRRNFVSALITLDDENLGAWLRARGLVDLPEEARASHPEIVAFVQAAVDRLNESLARHETIKRFAILPRDFSVESGELTASLKVKRKVVEARHKERLDALYSGT